MAGAEIQVIFSYTPFAQMHLLLMKPLLRGSCQASNPFHYVFMVQNQSKNSQNSLKPISQ